MEPRAPRPLSAEEGILTAIGEAAQEVATTVGAKSVEAERIGLERDKVNSSAETKRYLIATATLSLVVLAMLGFSAYALGKGEPGSTLAADVIKFGLGAALGGFGGWGLRASREKRNGLS